MHLAIMYEQYAGLGPQIHTQLSRYVFWFGDWFSHEFNILLQGELEHRRVKRFYARTNKNSAIHQMTRLERREFALQKLVKLKGKAASSGPAKGSTKIRTNVSFEDSEALPYTPAEEHHHISKSRNYHMNIMAFLSSNRDDPAIMVKPWFLSIGGYTDLLLFL